MRLKPYQKYLSSGSDGIGDIPEQWSTVKLKFLSSKISSGKTPLGGSEVYVNNGVLFLRSQNVYDDGLRLSDAVYISEEVDKAMAGSRVEPGDILINITGASIGRTCLVPDPFPTSNVNQHVCIIRVTDPKFRTFVSLAMKAAPIKLQITSSQNGAARDGLNYEQLGSILIPMPQCQNERDAIASFLDRETAKIDTLIAKQEKLIELLKEKRQAVISHAVTKGLDPTVPMKPSCVEWLGDVPEHWNISPIKYLIKSIEQGWSPQCDGYPAGPDEWGVLKVGCVNGGAFKPEENKALPKDLLPVPELGISNGDLLISRANTRELVGSAAVATDNYPRLMLCDKLYRLRIDPDQCAAQFVALLLGTSMARNQIELAAGGASASMVNIAQGTILNLQIGLPGVNEQVTILTVLKKKTGRIDTLIAKAEQAIALQKEHRTALISAAVTGKIDVRGETEERKAA